MIRILHIVPALDGGGVENLLLNYYSHMDTKKLVFDFIVHGKGTGVLESVFETLNSKIYHIPTKRESLKDNLASMKKIITEGCYDVVHAHQGPIAVFPMYYAKKAGVKVRITHSHQSYIKQTWKKVLFDGGLKIFLKIYTTHWFACGKDAGADLWGKRAVRNNKVFVLNNAIDLPKFEFNSEIRNKYRLELGIQDNIVIGNVGRLSSQKNQEFLLDIFKEIYDKDDTSILLLVGRGELEQVLKQKVEKLGLINSVFFLGIRNDVEKLLQAMDLFLLPSRHEGLPVVLVEAQASGLMSYASENVTREVNITNMIKYLSLTESPKVWADKILSSIPYMRKNISSQLEEKGYSIKEEARKLEKLYEEISS